MDSDSNVVHAVPPTELERRQRPALLATRLAYTEAGCRVSVIANFVQMIAMVAVLVWTYNVYRAALVRQPLVLAVDRDGQFHTIDPSTLKFRPTDQTLRGALMQFVREHCERVPLRVLEDYGHSLVFMDRRLAGQSVEADTPKIKALRAGQGEEVRVNVLNVSLRNTRHECADKAGYECQATVSSEKTYYSLTDHRLLRTIQSSAEITFVLKDEITDQLLRNGNPAGLVVSDFHEYDNFQTTNTETGVPQ